MSAILFLMPALGGFAAGLTALGAVLWRTRRQPSTAHPVSEADMLSEPRLFRFRNGYLVDHSDNVAFLLPGQMDRLRAWDVLAAGLERVNAGIPHAFEALRTQGRPFKLSGLLGGARLVVVGLRDGDDLRVTVAAAEARQGSVRIDLPSLNSLEAETAMLARAGDTSPVPGWAVDAGGRVIWSNTAYRALVARCEGPDAAAGWPIRTLFPLADGPDGGTSRRVVRDRAGDEHWYEVTASAAQDGLRHAHALPLEAVIRAEGTLRAFIQTLTRSFAHLPTGVAIFDPAARLTMFNPALADLTGLDAAWLVRKPLLAEVLAAARDRQRGAAPRDARPPEADGARAETWSLPGGATLRAGLHPQADGSTTLIVEDATAADAAGRRQREAQGALACLVEDLDEALVVFDSAGQRIGASGAATALWRDDGGPLPATLDACLAFWRTLCRPSRAWSDLRAMLAQPEAERAGWTDIVTTVTGEALRVSVGPLPGGQLSLAFARAVRLDPRERAPAPHALQA